MQVVDGLIGQVLIFGQAEIVVRFDEVDQMMGHASALIRCRFGSADIQVAIDLAAVRANDLAIEARRARCIASSVLPTPVGPRMIMSGGSLPVEDIGHVINFWRRVAVESDSDGVNSPARVIIQFMIVQVLVNRFDEPLVFGWRDALKGRFGVLAVACLTSTKTNCSPSRATISISPNRVDQLTSTML